MTRPSFPSAPRRRAPAIAATLAGLLLSAASAPAAQAPGPIAWRPWTDDLFETAAKERKFVILDLEAVWCHWCHVMEEKTYADPAVRAVLAERWIAVRADQDARPDLSTRYRDWGWPATIFFAPDGTEIAKRAGYIEPEAMARLLRAVERDPSPEPEAAPSAPAAYAESPFLAPALRAELAARDAELYDEKNGGWGFGGHKFLDRDSVEHAIALARDGDAAARRRAEQTLAANLALFDPVWGGVYQYSTRGDWAHPHYEKIMHTQAGNLRIYALAYAAFGKPQYKRAMEDVHRYLRAFLRAPEGAFFPSQDADAIPGEKATAYFGLGDAERRKIGVPRVDAHLYARENGWAAEALAAAYGATGDAAYLEDARRAAEWAVAHRALPGGGFRHDERDAAGPYLGDTLAMARGMLALHRATGERPWLERAAAALAFVDANFRAPEGRPGYVSAAVKGKAARPHLDRDENVWVARVANLLAHYTGKAEHREIAERAMRFVATPEIAREPYPATTLLVDREMTRPPLHLTVVGAKGDAAAKALFAEALRYPAGYKRLDWIDRREGAPLNPDVQYPDLPRPAAFVCTDKRCSLPIFDAAKVAETAERLAKR